MRAGHRGLGLLQALLTLVAVAGLVALGLMMVGLDEPLDRTTTACLQQAPPPRAEDNAFFAVLGLNAPPGLSAVNAGRAAAASYQSALEKQAARGHDFRFEFPAAKVESEDAIRRLCDPLEGGCPASYLARATQIGKLLAAHGGMLANYRQLPRFQSFVMTLTPHLQAPVFPAGHLVMAQRLLHAQSVLLLAEGASDEAAAALVDDFAVARLLLAEADHLVYKMVAAALMARSLKLLSQIADAIRPLPEAISDLQGLTRQLGVDELSLASPLCGEFRLLASVFLRPEAVVSMAEADGMSFGFLARLAYKPHATVNRAFADLHATLEQLDALPHPEFAERYPDYMRGREQEQDADTLDHLLTWPWNPVGSILVSVARPTYARWYARLYDLEGLRRMVVLKLLVRKHSLGDEQLAQLISDRVDGLADPYTDAPLRFDTGHRVLSFGTLSARATAQEIAGRWDVALPRPD